MLVCFFQVAYLKYLNGQMCFLNVNSFCFCLHELCMQLLMDWLCHMFLSWPIGWWTRLELITFICANRATFMNVKTNKNKSVFVSGSVFCVFPVLLCAVVFTSCCWSSFPAPLVGLICFTCVLFPGMFESCSVVLSCLVVGLLCLTGVYLLYSLFPLHLLVLITAASVIKKHVLCASVLHFLLHFLFH